ncbi:hypothetical protein INR49_001941 [Caranx melampygus]|nr:hypothetical protein INR49_001941 [Caranx melampygus]
MSPCGLLQPLPSVGFEAKIHFSASQDLCIARSKYFKLPETRETQGDVWSIKPPDFSLRLYTSLSGPQKKDSKTRGNPADPQTTETKRRTRTGIFLPHVSDERFKRKELPEFIAPYRPPDALETDLMFIRAGKFPSEPYNNPKPHNFRPLDEDLPDMVTTYDRDPGNLSLRLKHLDTLSTIRSDFSSRDTATKMDTYKPAEPMWDVRLILPQPPWPPKSASYTVSRCCVLLYIYTDETCVSFDQK